MLALEFPPINEILRWRDLWSAGGLNKIGIIAVLAALIGDRHLPARREQGPDEGAEGHPQLRRDDRRVHRGPDHHADDGQARPRLDAVHAQPVRVHLPLQRARHHPVPADARHRPHRDPAVPVAARVGRVHRRRLQAPGLRLPQELAVPARRARRALHPRDADRVHLDVPRPPVLADGPTLRQHARRSHPARDVRDPHRRTRPVRHDRPQAGRDPARSSCSCSSRPSRCSSPSCRPTSSRSSPAVYIGGAAHPEH